MRRIEFDILSINFICEQMKLFSGEDLIFTKNLFQYEQTYYKRGAFHAYKLQESSIYDNPNKKSKWYSDFCESYNLHYKFIDTVLSDEKNWKFRTKVVNRTIEIVVLSDEFKRITNTELSRYQDKDTSVRNIGQKFAEKIKKAPIVNDIAEKLILYGYNVYCPSRIIAGRNSFCIDIYIGKNGVSALFDGDRCDKIVVFSDYNLKPLTEPEEYAGLFVAILDKYKELALGKGNAVVFGEQVKDFFTGEKTFNLYNLQEESNQQQLHGWT